MDASWDNLRFFITLARSGSKRTAAALLQVSESTVRRHVEALEGELGVTLFERVEGKYLLTPAGRQLLPVSEEVERAVDCVRETLHGGDQRVAGRVRVGAGEGLGSLCIAPLLARLQVQSPELTIELLTLPRTPDLGRREVDVAMVGIKPEAGGSHRIRSLGHLTLRLYASASYLSRHPPIESVESLTTHRMIGYSDQLSFATAIRRASADAGLTRTPHFASSSIIAQARAASAGAGIALLPSYAAEPHLHLVPVLHDELELQFPFWLMVHADMASLARVRAVVSAIASLFPIQD